MTIRELMLLVVLAAIIVVVAGIIATIVVGLYSKISKNSREQDQYEADLCSLKYFVQNLKVNEQNRYRIIMGIEELKESRFSNKRKYRKEIADIYKIYERRFYNAN